MSVLSVANQKLVEENLISEGYITRERLAALKEKARNSSTPFFGFLVKEGHLPNEALTKVIAQVNHVPYVNLTDARIDRRVLRLIPKEIAERYMAVPLGQIKGRLVVAMLDADNVQAVDYLAKRINRPVKVYTASEEGIRQILSQYAEDVEADVAKVMSDSMEAQQAQVEPDKKSEKKIKTIVQDSPISKALSTILEYAAKHRASDIHIEPLEKELKIRCRIDGVLREIMKLPKSTEPPLISRIKILSNLKIDEHRIPQDGGFTVAINKNTAIDLRIAISPVVWGEQVVIRLLDKTGTSLKLEDMGYHGRALRMIRNSIQRPNGMILTSGPTGSGKSTSLYAMVQEIKNDAINIVTLEDPVEYKMEGINQIQVNPAVGLTFASGLRSILRQDPDVVMVGEIRDKETATLAVQAALTGHLVFSTLHTNSASGILPRLLDMGIEPFLIASTVHTVIGQRLVRRLADNKERYQSDITETEAIRKSVGRLLAKDEASRKAISQDLGFPDLPLASQNGYTLFKGKDSPETPGGYKGRMGLYEVFHVDETIQQLILKHSTSSEIQKAAIAQGMVNMREDGYLKALSGYTSVAEVNRVAAEDSA
ncbi:MAG TPA: GspE/PulE family protein [Candidatus Saccharimonadales bacterium]|nr:GspE/PulE family protein [Candidatus Saccharimonadales bacterium]